MEREAEVKDEALSPGSNEDREWLVEVTLFLLKKGDPLLLQKGGVNHSLPQRMDTFSLKKEADESGPFLTQKVVEVTKDKYSLPPKGNNLS